MSGATKPLPERLEEGKKFEDFCNDVLWRNGIAIGLYSSKWRQWRVGESRIGAEIKYDDKEASTGNLFIETRERRDESGLSQWRASGIYDAADSWLYVIGNYHRIWIFGTRFLRQLHDTSRYEQKKLPTAEGFLLPRDDAEKYCLRKIDGAELTAAREGFRRNETA